LTIKAAAKIANAVRYPQRSTTAMANPVAGQIGVALGWIDASCRPKYAVVK
jgi:hypothetical protein